MTDNTNTTVYVGLSGGVDSSVSAALLMEAGYDVVGVFIKVWHPPFFECDWKKERRDAMRVCAHLDIPFKMLDLEDEYKEFVVDYMIDEYKAGRTPNPDIMCNAHIKFGRFLEWAIEEEGADYVATGHYARTREITNNKHQITNHLLQAEDERKDQTYFLWQLTQGQLQHVLFPIGNMEKSEVRSVAEEKGLFTHEKKDSQGLCFVGDVDMKDFLGRFIDLKEGNVLNESGEVIGRHDGAQIYTLGQRRGFEVIDKQPDDGPWYIIDKNIDENTLTVRQSKENDILENGNRIALSSVNWINGKEPDTAKEYRARIRYNQSLQKCHLIKRDGWEIEFAEPQRAATAGQSVVVYDGQACLGGGVIEEVSSVNISNRQDRTQSAVAHTE